MQHAHACVELYDGFLSQLALLIAPHLQAFIHIPPYVPYMYLDLVHAHIIVTHGLA